MVASRSPSTIGNTSEGSMPCCFNSTLAATTSDLTASNSASCAFLANISARAMMSLSEAMAIFCFLAFSISFEAMANSSFNRSFSASGFLLSSCSSSKVFCLNSSFSLMCLWTFASNNVCTPISLSFRSSRSSSTSIFLSRVSCSASMRVTFGVAVAFTFANFASSSSFSRASASAMALACSTSACICANSAPVFSTTVVTTFSMTFFLSGCNDCTTVGGNTGGTRTLGKLLAALALPTLLWLPLPLALEASLTLSMAARFASAIAISTLSMMAGASCAPPLA
mmetsp:Transcript_133365/g.386029  ORF Transcript_133365/g.386029 Transcript_133365/m.386029 type:complete len:283 (-) Transcript_133365:506-1354(-)